MMTCNQRFPSEKAARRSHLLHMSTESVNIRYTKLRMRTRTLFVLPIFVFGAMVLGRVLFVHISPFARPITTDMQVNIDIISPPHAEWPQRIPRIVHFVWVSADAYGRVELPPVFQAAIKVWREAAPDHRIILWDDAAVLELLKSADEAGLLAEHLHENLLQFYLSLQRPILRADFIRYIIAYIEGGLITDLDLLPLIPLSEWFVSPFWNGDNLADVGVVLAPECRDDGVVQMTGYCVERHHPALLTVIKGVIVWNEAHKGETIDDAKVLQATGPHAFTRGMSHALLGNVSKLLMENMQEDTGVSILNGTVALLPFADLKAGRLLHANVNLWRGKDRVRRIRSTLDVNVELHLKKKRAYLNKLHCFSDHRNKTSQERVDAYEKLLLGWSLGKQW